jgi:hypothetical protein
MSRFTMQKAQGQKALSTVDCLQGVWFFQPSDSRNNTGPSHGEDSDQN